MGIPERKQRDLARREQEILQAALRLFAREDWQTVTIERIAQEAEVGKGTVYLHFQSKEDIYGRLALDFTAGVLDLLRNIDPALPVVEQLRAAIHVFFQAHTTGPHHCVVEYCDRDDFRKRVGEEIRVEMQRADEEIGERIHAILQRGIDEGVFAPRPIPVLRHGAQAALVGAVRLLGSDCSGLPDLAQREEEITRFVLAGLMFLDRVEQGRGAAKPS
jgi:AcrR family transcriptional regulator